MAIRTIIVDDSANFREMIQKILQKMSEIEVVGSACDGEEALQIVNILRPDLILMDIRMPGMDGIKALEVMKNNYPNIKVIMITNYEMYEYRQVSNEKGADGFLLKKDLFRELVPLVQSLF